VSEPRASDVGITGDALVIHLADGRTVTLPLASRASSTHPPLSARIFASSEMVNTLIGRRSMKI
jgi:hypothetical protein